MAHFAQLDENNVVLQVIVIGNDDINNLPFPESEPVGIEFLINWSGGYTNWKQTSYNSNFRKNYAAVGGVYDSVRDAFIHPKPYPSWVLDENTCTWKPPIPPILNGKHHRWDEDTVSWVEVLE